MRRVGPRKCPSRIGNYYYPLPLNTTTPTPLKMSYEVTNQRGEPYDLHANRVRPPPSSVFTPANVLGLIHFLKPEHRAMLLNPELPPR
jgi:hypothetical protein